MTRKAPTRTAIYVRVSSPDQVDNFSLEAQEEVARKYAQEQGWQVYRVYADEGYSARTADRPAFQMMLRDSKLKKFNIILVHKLDRFFRNLGELLQHVQRLDQREVRLVSISEDIDFSTASGRMLLTSIGMISEFYSNNLREETIKGLRQRAQNGLWNSCIPFGYQRGRCDTCADPTYRGPCPNATTKGVCPGQMMFPHPKNAEGVRQAFTFHAKGKSDQEVADFLNQRGYCPDEREHARYLEKFTKETIRDMLQNETYLGFVKYHEELLPGLHEPLIDRTTYERSQQVRRAARTLRRQPSQRRFYLLSGLIRCDHCGHKMRGMADVLKSKGEVRYYRDAANEYGEQCDQRRVQAAGIEAQVASALTRIKVPANWQKRIALLAQATPEAENLKKKRRTLRSRAKRLQKLFLREHISEKRYEKQHAAIQQQLTSLTSEANQAGERITGLVEDFSQLWKLMTPAEQKRVVQTLIKAVYVRGQNVVRIEYRRAFAALQPVQS